MASVRKLQLQPAQRQAGGRSVPFIVPADERSGGSGGGGGFTVAPEAVALLNAIKTPVAPIAVVGMCGSRPVWSC
jgi:hypothetical protein